jgi:hypothetical protein
MQSQEVHRKQANSNNTSQENSGRKRQPRGHADAEAERKLTMHSGSTSTGSNPSGPNVSPPSVLRTVPRQLHLPFPWKMPLRPEPKIPPSGVSARACKKPGVFFEFSPCLCQACLGKMIIFEFITSNE